MYHFAEKGDMTWQVFNSSGKTGIELVFIDQGPGIADIGRAMEIGYTTRKGLGLGLPGAKRLMDEFDMWSEVGRGTRVTVRKYMG